MRVRIARSPAGIVAAVLLLQATPATAQRRAVPGPPGMTVGLALGVAGVDVRQRGSRWDIGPLAGARWGWRGERSGVNVALDVQPFLASAGGTAGDYRALWLMPAWEFRTGSAGLRAGLGLGFLRFEQERFDGRTEVAMVTGAGASVRLPASLSLELVWRRTGIVRGVRSDIWSLQLARLWPI
ncbi:MAG: hypothetical protein PVH00_04005 [Gemmatimonadota bacterium]|jgi:hypothetical protein